MLRHIRSLLARTAPQQALLEDLSSIGLHRYISAKRMQHEWADRGLVCAPFR